MEEKTPLTSREVKKAVAVELMKQLGIYCEFIKKFKTDDVVCKFENCVGYRIYQYPELQKKLKEIEEERNCVVYAVIHEFTEFDELYDFLLVPDYKEDWKYLLKSYSNRQYSVYAYVWNKTDEYFSESGSILVESFGGGIGRIG